MSGHNDPENVWYEEGIQFACTRCRKCCHTHGEYAFVYVDVHEVAEIARFLNLTPGEFRDRYTTRVDGWLTLRFDTEACTFLGPEGCTIYPVRPKQCRTWPFWPRNLKREVWEQEVKPFCPGIDRGRLYSRKEIDEIADTMD